MTYTLIKESEVIRTEETLIRRSFMDLLKGRPLVAHEFSGRIRWSDALIQFPVGEVAVSRRFTKPIVFGNKLYHGVAAYYYYDSLVAPNTYWCYIDHVEDIIHGKVKE